MEEIKLFDIHLAIFLNQQLCMIHYILIGELLQKRLAPYNTYYLHQN